MPRCSAAPRPRAARRSSLYCQSWHALTSLRRRGQPCVNHPLISKALAPLSPFFRCARGGVGGGPRRRGSNLGSSCLLGRDEDVVFFIRVILQGQGPSLSRGCELPLPFEFSTPVEATFQGGTAGDGQRPPGTPWRPRGRVKRGWIMLGRKQRGSSHLEVDEEPGCGDVSTPPVVVKKFAVLLRG